MVASLRSTLFLLLLILPGLVLPQGWTLSACWCRPTGAQNGAVETGELEHDCDRTDCAQCACCGLGHDQGEDSEGSSDPCPGCQTVALEDMHPGLEPSAPVGTRELTSGLFEDPLAVLPVARTTFSLKGRSPGARPPVALLPGIRPLLI